jgi:long-chain-fatty-acid--CoA ligase ACSBG
MIATLMGGKLDNSEHIVSYLPLSHVAAQMLDVHMPVCTGTQCNFAQPDALKGTLGMTLKIARPTVLFGVPRVWEMIYDRLQRLRAETRGMERMLATWA